MSDTHLLRNKAVVSALIEAVWRQGDLAALPDFWTPDCVNHADPNPERSGLHRLRAYHEGFGAAFAGFSSVQIDIERQVAEGDLVTTQIATRATHAPTGKPVVLKSMRIDRLWQGKIAEHWSVSDMADLTRQLSG